YSAALDSCDRIVRRIVVDDDDFVDRQRLGCNASQSGGDPGSRVVARHNDGSPKARWFRLTTGRNRLCLRWRTRLHGVFLRAGSVGRRFLAENVIRACLGAASLDRTTRHEMKPGFFEEVPRMFEYVAGTHVKFHD